MSVPDEILAGMRETKYVFCSSVVRLRDIESPDRVYTSEPTFCRRGPT